MWIKKLGRVLLVAMLSVLLFSLIAASAAVVAFGAWAYQLPDRRLDTEIFESVNKDRTTRLYCRTLSGEVTELSEDRISGYENALFCPLEQMSPHLIDAFVAIEDKRFFQHGGIDWARTASAVLNYMRGSDKSFGGSTITQQLVKNITGDNERSVRRKVAELLRAVQVEKIYSKNEILEQYLNVVSLSQGCYGVRTAANVYFSKEPSELSLDEAATLAAITNNPSKYDPIKHPQQSRTRRDIILSEMLKQGKITQKEYEHAVSAETVLTVNDAARSVRINSWYADMVIEDVIAALVRERGMTEAAASRLVYCGGLKIYTPMVRELQEIVSDFYEDPNNFPTHECGKKAQSALMLLDPHTGEILAVSGAVGKKSSNRVQSYATKAKRPSGSIIKPLSVYAPALEGGLITYATVFDDVPLSFRENGAPWPRNSPNLYRGLTTVNTALMHSVNTVSVSVLKRVGNANSYRFLTEKLGFSSLDKEKDLGAAALALGQQHTGVMLREIVGGYTALAGEGVYHAPQSFLRVEGSDGKILLQEKEQGKRVLDESNAAILTMMLRGAVREGTGSAITADKQVEIAGKTGTTGKNCDKWFVGYTPELLCGVWYGYEYPAPLNDVKGNPALGIFDTVMQKILSVSPAKKRVFETPDDVIAVRFCRDSGQLLSDACHLDPRGDRSEIGYFKKGSEPREHCSCHVCISYCEGGGIAGIGCPHEGCRQVALLRILRHFPRQICVQDAPYTYAGVVPNIQPNFTSNEPYYALYYNSKQNFGIGMDVIPYNRLCPAHHGDPFWRRRGPLA